MKSFTVVEERPEDFCEEICIYRKNQEFNTWVYLSYKQDMYGTTYNNVLSQISEEDVIKAYNNAVKKKSKFCKIYVRKFEGAY